jgi:hypothetical protein
LIGYDLGRYSLDTVSEFYQDYIKAWYKI